MKGKLFSTLLLAVLTTSFVQADDYCAADCCESTWSAHAEWLYWNARKCGLDYAWREEFIDGSDEIPNELGFGKSKAVELDYTSGIRIGLHNQSNGGLRYGVHYTYYKNDEKASFTDTGLNYQNSRVLPGTRNDTYATSPSFVESNFDYASSNYDLEFQVLDFEISKAYHEDCEKSVHYFGGVRVARIDQDLQTRSGVKANFATDRTQVDERHDLKAYGVYLGGEGVYNYCGDFGFFGRFSVATLVADNARQFRQKNLTAGENFVVADVKDEFWCHVNALQFAVGVNYDLCQTGCVDWSVRAGYEFQTWFNLSDFANFCGYQIEGHPARQKDSIGFDGLFVRLGGSF